jgi:hypothetical protein
MPSREGAPAWRVELYQIFRYAVPMVPVAQLATIQEVLDWFAHRLANHAGDGNQHLVTFNNRVVAVEAGDSGRFAFVS